MQSDRLPAEVSFLVPSIVPDLIRVGRWEDGGYIVPYSAVQSAQALISCGINRDWSFEQNFSAINPSAVIHGYDDSISLEMFRRQFQAGLLKAVTGRLPRAAAGDLLWRWRDFHAFFGSKARHYQEKIVRKEEGQAEATLDKAFSRIDADRRVFLKVDIEGREYEIIDAVLEHANRMTAVAMEFHKTGLRRAEFCKSVRDLQREFEIVHLHGNNCGPRAPDGLPEYLEITFVPRTGAVLAKRTELPIPIDRPNDFHRADYPLRFNPTLVSEPQPEP